MSSNNKNKGNKKTLSSIQKVEWYLLIGLGLLLLFLTLWCFVFGKCHFSPTGRNCDCNCNDTIVPPNPTPVHNQDDGPAPVPHTGDVQILLSWSNYNDLDLSCIDPYGYEVWYGNHIVPSGGELDIDMNAGGPSSRNPIENIYWPSGGAPKGKYQVRLTFFSVKDNVVETPYEVKVKHGNNIDTYTGTLNSEKQIVDICSFEID